jgi:hypothetical protein
MTAMATPSKRGTAKRSARPASKKTEKTDKPSGPFLRFHHSEALRKRTLAALGALEGAPDPTAHRAALADVVVELTNCGLDSFFMQPLKDARAGFIVQQSASLGLAGARQVMGSVVRNILGRMDGPQLLSVCGSIRKFMR